MILRGAYAGIKKEKAMQEIWMPVATFLGGSLITVLIFVLPFTNKLTALSSNLNAVSTRLDAHIASTPPVCSFHQEIANEGATARAERTGFDARIKRLEDEKERH